MDTAHSSAATWGCSYLCLSNQTYHISLPWLTTDHTDPMVTIACLQVYSTRPLPSRAPNLFWMCCFQGLPLAVTIALAYSMKSMMADNCLVRVLASCETMGGVPGGVRDVRGVSVSRRVSVRTRAGAGRRQKVAAASGRQPGHIRRRPAGGCRPSGRVDKFVLAV